MIYVIFMSMLMLENQKCVDFDKSCRKTEIIELRKLCTNVQHIVQEMELNNTSIWTKSGYECLEAAPKNKLVIEYKQLLKIDAK